MRRPWLFSWRTLRWHIQSEVLVRGTAVKIPAWLSKKYWVQNYTSILVCALSLSLVKRHISFWDLRKRLKQEEKKGTTHSTSSLCSRFCLFGLKGKSLTRRELPDAGFLSSLNGQGTRRALLSATGYIAIPTSSLPAVCATLNCV